MALTDNLVSWWSLDEASGTRYDSHGTNHLTDNNTVGSATGKVGNAASFVAANSESLSIVDNASLSMGAGVRLTIAAWVHATSLAFENNIVAKRTGHLEYYLRVRNNRFDFEVSATGATPVYTVVGANTITTGVWYFVVAGYDGTNLFLSINDGALRTTAYIGDIFDGTSSFVVGSRGTNDYWTGEIDEVAIWKRALSSAEITELYNSGAGVSYANISGGGGSDFAGARFLMPGAQIYQPRGL